MVSVAGKGNLEYIAERLKATIKLLEDERERGRGRPLDDGDGDKVRRSEH